MCLNCSFSIKDTGRNSLFSRSFDKAPEMEWRIAAVENLFSANCDTMLFFIKTVLKKRGKKVEKQAEQHAQTDRLQQIELPAKVSQKSCYGNDQRPGVEALPLGNKEM
jgi:hypothetical protein